MNRRIKPLYSVSEAAKLIGTYPRHLRRLIERGALTAIWIGNKMYLDFATLAKGHRHNHPRVQHEAYVKANAASEDDAGD